MNCMAVQVQNLSKKNFDERSIHSPPNISVGFQPWWNSNEQKVALSLPPNISLEVETPSKLYQNAKHLDLQLPDQELTSAQAIGQSCPEMGVIRVTNSPFYSSESGQDESCGKNIEGQMKPVLLNNPNAVFSPSNPNYNHSMGSAQYPYVDAYVGGLFTPYGQPAIIQGQMAGGSAPARILLPLDLAEDGPIYVNAKQYHGILRRRRHRAKLEAQNKLVKSRKPYLHESRHLHALNRVRGSGGRFLSKEKLPPHPTFNMSSCSISDASCLDQKNSVSELESHSRAADCSGSSTSCLDISRVSNNNGNFQLPKRGFMDISPGVSSMFNRIQHCTSVVL